MADTSTSSWKLLYEAGRQALQARKLQEAEQSFSAALQLAEDFAPGDPRLVATLNALARIYSLQRRYLAAAALLNRLLEVTERTLGPTHVQVAGVLTNLAEMYTHLGAAREELELRERVLSIRVDDPNADANSLLRLRERVDELRAALTAQESPASSEAEAELEALPIVRTDEYSSPVEATAHHEAEVEAEMVVAIEPTPAKRSERIEQSRDTYRMSPALDQFAIAPWPGAAATGTTPTGAHQPVKPDYTPAPFPELRPAIITSPRLALVAGPDRSMLSFSDTTDHGFSDMGRDELTPLARKMGSRSSMYSIAAGLLLVAGILLARNFVSDSDDERESAGSVSLAAANAATIIPPAAAPAPVRIVPVSETPAEPKTVEQVLAERKADREARRVSDAPREGNSTTERAVRPPTSPELERTLRGLDVTVKAIDQRTKAVTDSAAAIRVQAPTFKRVKIADP